MMVVTLKTESLASAPVRLLLDESDAEARRVYADSWSPHRGSTVAASDFDGPTGCFLVAYLDERPVACGGFRTLGKDAAEIKRLFVTADVRRQGIATHVLRHLEELAAETGYRLVRLDTGARQSAAVALFKGAGYREVEDYNRNELAAHWFEKRLSK